MQSELLSQQPRERSGMRSSMEPERKRKIIKSLIAYLLAESVGGKYKVFFSFRGTDTRYSFTEHLYDDLKTAGVRTFRDDNEFRRGEEFDRTLKAIEESKIAIPILSKNYASCKWCLAELATIVECRRTKGQVVLPIFYDFSPSSARRQSGSYEEAFRAHTKNYDGSTVEEWKEALIEVADLPAFNVDNNPDIGYCKKQIETIVQKVLSILNPYTLAITDNLVGIVDHADEVIRLLGIGSSDTRIVGIHGMSGIGKTTIAKLIYNAFKGGFDCHSFLADIRETVQQFHGLVHLQQKLLKDTQKRCPSISDAEGGLDVIRKIFRKKKVLLVLDDVIEISQFYWLVGSSDWFGSGSKIIVTSKDKSVLNDIKVDATFEPPFMNPAQSLQLFSIHAFGRKFPPEGYVSISNKVASNAAGLPLTLEVMGSFLYGKVKVEWEDTLEKLKKISHDEVERKWRIIYEALNYRQQQIFLDISCLFTGIDKRTAFYMWDACGYLPGIEFYVLYRMFLVKVDGATNKLRMHDQFRTLGRKIVCEEELLRNRSRLWKHEDALNILEGRSGTEKVEALTLCFALGSGKEPRFESKEFSKLTNLRYLRADGIELVGDFKSLFPNLRWLRWRGCPPFFKPTNFHLENLAILDLSDSRITEDWEGWNQIKMANKLKVLQLANCALRRTPDFSSYATLKILILQGCRNLVDIDSVCDLKNLEVLDVSCVAGIRRLPVGIGQLNLKILKMGF